MYKVKETPCYPNSWKVYIPNHESNDISRFFPTKELAEAKAKELNAVNTQINKEQLPSCPCVHESALACPQCQEEVINH